MLLLLAQSAAAHTGNGIVADPATRTIYFTDSLRSCVWRVDAAGRLDYFAGDLHGNNLARDAAGNLYIDHFNRSLWKIAPDGRKTRLVDGGSIGSLDELLAIDAAGNFYLAGGNDFRGRRPVLLKRTADGTVLPFAAGADFAGADFAGADFAGARFAGADFAGARFNALNSAAWGGDGALYVSDANAVRRVAADGTVTTVAGGETPGFLDGPAATAKFTSLLGLAIDSGGNIYVADRGNQCVRRISAAGEVTTLLRPDGPWTPVAVAVAGEDVYVLERKFFNVLNDLQLRHDMPRVVKIAAGGKRAVIAMVEGNTFAGVALFAVPVGVFLAAVLIVRWLVKRRPDRGGPMWPRPESRQPAPPASLQSPRE